MDDYLDITLGARYDDHDTYGDSFNPRIGVVVKPYNNGILKFLAGSAFREPNVFELTKNKDLQPMTMESYEISYIHHFS